MKKLVVLGSLSVLCALSSCKKEYTCCLVPKENETLYDDDCSTEDMTKSEKEDKEDEGYECE